MVMSSPFVLVGAGTVAPGLTGGGSAVARGIRPRNTLQLPPHLYPPETARSFNLAVNVGITGAGTRVTPPELSQRMPKNCYGTVAGIDFDLDGIVITSRVFWTVLVNGSPVQGFNALTVLGRNGAASVSRSVGAGAALGILVPIGGLVSVSILDADGGTYTAGTQVYGWFWPQESGAGDTSPQD